MHKTYATRIVSDEAHRPIAVQVDYADWLEIERLLGTTEMAAKKGDIRPFIGKLKKWPEDPVAFQRRVRDEWD